MLFNISITFAATIFEILPLFKYNFPSINFKEKLPCKSLCLLLASNVASCLISGLSIVISEPAELLGPFISPTALKPGLFINNVFLALYSLTYVNK